MTLKCRPHLFAPACPNPINMITIKDSISFLLLLVPKQTSRQSSLATRLNKLPHLSLANQQRHLCKCTFSKSLTYNLAILKERCNRGINLQVTFQNITNKNRLYMKSPSPEAQCAENVFRMQYPRCAISFTNNISRSG